MSIRKRTWTTTDGKRREAFVVDFRDAKGKRTIKTFAAEKEAKTFRGQTEQPGHKHVAVRSTPTVRQAADRWLVAVEMGTRRAATERVEPSTLRQYAYHVRRYIEPELGDMRLGELTEERVRQFRDHCLGKLSRAMSVKVVGTLKAILIEERYNGAALDVTFGKASRRHKQPVAIPAPSEIRALFSVMEGKPLYLRALISAAIYTGMRRANCAAFPGLLSTSSVAPSRSCSVPTRTAISARRRAPPVAA